MSEMQVQPASPSLEPRRAISKTAAPTPFETEEQRRAWVYQIFDEHMESKVVELQEGAMITSSLWKTK